MPSIRKIFFVTAALSILFACGNKEENAEKEPGLITISNQQFAFNDMQLGKVEKRVFENVVQSTGVIIPLPDGSAKVTAPIHGLITKVHCNYGQFVKKNQVLAEIGGVDILDLQKDFATVSSNFTRIKSEYDRITLLYGEKVSSEKEFILAKAGYKASLAEYNGLKLKIESVGLSPESVENGEFYTSYYVKAPIDGYISYLNAAIGSSVGAQNEIVEIVNPDLLQIKLSVFPKDIHLVRKGQGVRIKTTSSNKDVLGEIYAVGISIDPESKSIYCFANITDRKFSNRIANMYFESEIVTHLDTVYAIPQGSLIKKENEYYVLAFHNRDKDNYFFTKQKVDLGRESHGFFEVIDNKIDGMILTKGVYGLNID